MWLHFLLCLELILRCSRIFFNLLNDSNSNTLPTHLSEGSFWCHQPTALLLSRKLVFYSSNSSISDARLFFCKFVLFIFFHLSSSLTTNTSSTHKKNRRHLSGKGRSLGGWVILHVLQPNLVKRNLLHMYSHACAHPPRTHAHTSSHTNMSMITYFKQKG